MPRKILSCAFLIAAAAAALPAAVHAQKGDTIPASGYISGTYEYSHFLEGPDPWQFASLSVGRKMSLGSIIGRANFARRFSNDGFQGELDAYPRLTPNVYAYLNVGYSESEVFPRWRSGAEIFASLNDAWEASVGYRQLRFSGKPTTLFTGAVGKYSGNWWTSVRPFIRKKDVGLAASVGLTVRRYTVDGDNYLGATLSGGSSPSDRVDPSQLAQTSSWSAGVHGSWSFQPRVTAIWAIGYDNETLPSRDSRRRLDTSIGMRFDH